MIWSAQSAISVSFYSSIAQSVEHAAVNRAVVGSSPTRGAGLKGPQGFGPLAQLVRAPPCHGGGREFESLLGRYVGS